MVDMFQGNVITSYLFWILVVTGLLLLALVVIIYLSKIKTRREIIKSKELELERKKLEFMGKRMLLQELKESSKAPSDTEREQLDAIQMDNTILTKKIMHMMEEMDKRGKRLELGADTAKMVMTMREIKEKERQLFGRDID